MEHPMSKPPQTRIAVRRWAALQCRTEISNLVDGVANEPFDLTAMGFSCLRLACAGAAALALEGDDVIIDVAYFTTESFHLQLFEGERSDPADFATGYRRALLEYIRFAKRSLKIHIPFGFIDCIAQLLERSVTHYLSADPDVNWDILVRQCWALYDAVAANEVPADIEDLAERMQAEIARVPLPPETKTSCIDYDAIAKRHAPNDAALHPIEVVTGQYVPFDEGPRFHRLAERHDAMTAAGVPDADEYRRVGTELYHLTTDQYRVDPRRLYGDGPYPWQTAEASA